MKNPYFKRSHITKEAMEVIVEGFCKDLSAKEVHENISISYTSCKVIYMRIRQHIADYGHIAEGVSFLEIQEGIKLSDAIFGIINQNSKVIVVPAECESDDILLLPSVEDLYRGVFKDKQAHYRIHYPKRDDLEVSQPKNLLDAFWDYARSRMQKLRGVPAGLYYLYLRECQFRFNMRHKNMYECLLKSLLTHPL